jgi:hypothetical protein
MPKQKKPTIKKDAPVVKAVRKPTLRVHLNAMGGISMEIV